MDLSEAMDVGFLERLEELLEGKNIQDVCRRAMISRTYLDQIRRGDRRKLSYSVVRRLAAALGVRTALLGEGLASEEDRVESLATLHEWDVRIARQRMRYFERILAMQREEMAATQQRALVQATQETQRANDEAGPAETPRVRADSAA